jgi:hypothetical protein
VELHVTRVLEVAVHLTVAGEATCLREPTPGDEGFVLMATLCGTQVILFSDHEIVVTVL